MTVFCRLIAVLPIGRGHWEHMTVAQDWTYGSEENIILTARDIAIMYIPKVLDKINKSKAKATGKIFKNFPPFLRFKVIGRVQGKLKKIGEIDIPLC